MVLLHRLPLDGTISPETQADKIIRDALQRLGPGPHSLCELRLEEADYLWLSRWAASLHSSTVTVAESSLGCLVMLLAAEVARREAQEGHVWPVLPKCFRDPVTRQRLFILGEHPQPTPFLKDQLYYAGERLGLRHAFDRDDTQRWYLSIYLQFGFTHASIQTSLAEWLAGHPPTRAIELLCDPQHGSRSFRRLWDALRFFRRDYVTEVQMRQHLRETPWVLPSWIDEIIEHARDRIDELGTTSDDPNAQEEQHTFVESARLEWSPPDVPHARSRPADVSPLGLTGPRYHIELDGKIRATFFRQADGSYHCDVNELVLPCCQPSVGLSLVDAKGEIVATQVLDIWDATSDVNIFSAYGTAIDHSASLDPEQTYLLQTAADCRVLPEPASWQRVGGLKGRVWTILTDWREELRVCDASGRIVWAPRAEVEPDTWWAENCDVTLDDNRPHVLFGDRVPFSVTHLEPGVEVSYVRLNGRPRKFDAATGSIAPVRVTPQRAVSGWRFRIGLCREGVTTHIERQPSVPVLGAALFTHKGWQQLVADRFLPLQVIRNAPCRVFLPPEVIPERAAVLEGNIFLKRVTLDIRRLGVPAGLGAPVTLKSDAYNCADLLCRLSSGVDFGILDGIQSEAVGRQYRLHLRQAIQPAGDHSVVCWSPDHGIHQFTADEIQVADDGWKWLVPCPWAEQPNTVVCAIAFCGLRQGFAWWGNWGRLFSPMADSKEFSEEVQRIAALIRWCRLPILLPDKRSFSRRPIGYDFCRQHPAEVLSVWLFDLGLSMGLRFDESLETRKAEWAALRQIFAGWQPSAAQMQEILNLFVQAASGDPLEAIVKALVPEEPILGGRILYQAWLDTLSPKDRTIASRRLRRWRCEASGVSEGDGRSLIYQRENDALISAAEKMNRQAGSILDPFFVKAIADRAVSTLCKGRIEPHDAENLAVASEEGRFRQYLTLRVLSALEQSV